MGWKRGYYYSRGRYVGSGAVAVLAEALDDEERVQALWERDQNREARQAELAKFQEARRQAARVDSIVSRELTAAGLHRPSRHAWRKKSMATQQIQSPAVEAAALELAELAEFVFTEAVSKKSARTHDALTAKLKALCAELAGTDPSPALKLAVEAAALCWADWWVIELAAAANPLGASPALDRRRGWSQRRFSQALTTVERIRRLTRPRGPRVAVVVNNLTTQAPALDIGQRTLELAG